MILDSVGRKMENLPSQKHGLIKFLVVTIQRNAGIVAASFSDQHRPAILQKSLDRLFALMADHHSPETAAVDLDSDFLFNEGIIEPPHSLRMESKFFLRSQLLIAQLQIKMLDPSCLFGFLFDGLKMGGLRSFGVLLFHGFIDGTL